MWRGSQRRSVARRLRPRGRGAIADVPAGAVAMDHAPTRPLGLGDTRETCADATAGPRRHRSSTPAPTWGAAPLPASQLGPWRWIMHRRAPGLGDAADRRLRPRGRGATADVPAGTSGTNISSGEEMRASSWPFEILFKRTKSLIVAVGPVGAVDKRALGWPALWCAVVQGRRATTSRAYAFRRHVRVVVLGPAASTGHLVCAPRSRSGAWLPSAGSRSASTPLRRAELLRLASIAETSWRTRI